MNRSELIANHVFASNFNHTLHAYIDIAGGLIEGTLLGQIMYWFTPDENGCIRTKIKKDGEYWIVRKRSDWWNEIRITEKQYDRAIKSLLDKNLVIVTRYKFNSIPTTHLRPNYEEIGKQLDEYLYKIAQKQNAQKSAQISSEGKTEVTQKVNPNLPKGQIGSSPKGNLEVTERVSSIKENYKEIYKENYICATETCAQAPQNIDEMFDKFWKAYPKRRDKKRAYKVFMKIKPNNELLQKMLDAIEREKQTLDWQKNKGQYIPYPSTWLSNERWNDEDMTVEAVTEIDVKRSHSPVQAKKNIALVSLSRASKNSVSEPVIGDIGDMWGSDDDEY